MITGAHVLLYSENPELDRAFFRDVFGFRSVDAGEGWLIFALPPAEAAFHPIEGENRHLIHAGRRMLGAVMYFMCDDLQAELKLLKSKNVECSAAEEEPWGIKTTVRLPSGGEVGLYQPTHKTPLNLSER
jgi:catechol 2,3-dioxygenase-like lactoylglutathione lyase family enzyme